ncbi:hypothetical protein RMP67_05435 [Streptococcus suis]|uniref:hypothetical protein n=1 Tax=Streptococcus suis TaxID=1307 RepID=UPI0028C42BE9|nr:hypothetical protein [Streptococcus suis]WNO79459.1 hypothetical protein RMP67_05435 [Streptococcus suis]
MKELENVMSKLEKATKKKEQMDNQIKLLKQREKKLKRSAETQRKIKKGGVFEAFEREITGRQEETNNDLIYAFLDYVLSDNRYREKLKELTEIHLKDRETNMGETKNPDDENDSIDSQKVENSDEDIEADFLESED